MTKRLPLFFLSLALITTACGFGRTLRAPASTPVSIPARETPTARPVIPNDPITPDHPPDDLSLDDPAIFRPPGFAQTHRIELDFTFEGGSTASIQAAGAFSNSPPAFTLQYETYGNGILGGYEIASFTETGAESYFESTSTGCLANLTQTIVYPFASLLDPAQYLTGRAGRPSTEADIDGLPAFVFEIKPVNILNGPEQALRWEMLDRGRLYLAQTDGAFLGLELTGAGRAPELTGDASMSGQMTFTLYVLGINRPVDIRPPGGCADDESRAPGYPVMPEAHDVFSLPAGLTYLIDASVEDVAVFYQVELSALNWIETDADDDGLLATYVFEGPEGKKLTLTIAGDPAGGDTSVAIFEDPP